jgi:hypothetical protein
VVFCSDTHQSATSIRTTRSSPSGHPSVSRSSSEFEKIPVFHSNAIQGLTSIRVSASRHSYGKTVATVWTMCDPVRTMFSIRQDVHQFNRPDISLKGPDAPSLIMVITCSQNAVNSDSTIQSEVRRHSSSLSAVRTIVPSRPDPYYSCFFRPDDVPSRPDTISPTSSVRTMCFFRPDTYTVSRSFCASLLRLDISVARPDAYQFSNGSLILSKFKKGKINQSSGRCGILSGRISP